MAYSFETKLATKFYTPGPRPDGIKYIVIHHWGPLGQSFNGVRDFLSSATKTRETSAHYVVQGADADGTPNARVAQIVKDEDIAWQAGKWSANQESIGIECRPEATDADYAAVAELVVNLREKHGNLPLHRHQEFTATECPGDWDLARIESLTQSKGDNMATITYNGVTHTVTKRQGWTMDLRTAEFFDLVNSAMPGGVVIVQASFNKTVSASAGTHDGPGALDLKPADPNKRNTAGYKQLETICRQRGGAAWFRAWTNNYHVHMIVIGTKGLPAIAAKQVVSYLNGRDGLVSNLRITGVINTTLEKFKNAFLSIGGATANATKVKLLQKAVRQTIDGNWGEQTDIDLRNTRAEALTGYSGKYFNGWSDIYQKRMQKSWGAYQDGIWGAATKSFAKNTVVDIQRALGVGADGVWGPVTDRAFVALRQANYKGKSGLPSVSAPKPPVVTIKPIDFSLPFARGHAGFFPYPGKQGASYYGPSTAGKPWYSGKTAGGTNGESTWDTGNLDLAAIRSRIKKIQKFLGITQDGLYGAQTVAAVKKYQASKKFSQDGIVGPGTWQAMARDRGQ